MKNRTILRQTFEQGISAFLILGLIFPQSLWARQITLNRNMNFHASNGNVLKKQSTLPAGTIIEIPEEYLKNHQMQNASEASIVNWLRKGTDLFQFTNSHGEQKSDFFTPVKIVSIPDQTMEIAKDQTYYVALRYLAERKDGLSFETTAATESYKIDTEKSIAPEASTSLASKTEAACTSCMIQDPTPRTGTPLAKLQNLTKSLLEKVDSKSERYMATKNIAAIKANFESSCKGIAFEDYRSFLAEESKKANVPTEIMLGIMTQESSGLCLPRDSNGNYGLFQINKPSGSTKKAICSQSQRAQIRTASLEKLKSDASLQCLENPVVNAKEGIRILIEKFRSSNGHSPEATNLTWSERTISDRDDWRRATAGYNGGQGHVNRAIDDLKSFRDKYAPDLAVDSFELQQVFFFRTVLKEQGFVSRGAKARGTFRTIENLAYTASITGLDKNSQKDNTSFIALWEQDLYHRTPSVQVAKEL